MSSATAHYDLVVVGGGPAGIAAAVTASALGKTVAVVDNQPGLGGAGINTGTVPSKTLRETALALSGARARDLHGVDLSLRRAATVGDFLRHQESVRSAFNAMLAHELKSNDADVYFGNAAFVDTHTVRVSRRGSDLGRRLIGDGVMLRAERFLVATGSAPFRPTQFPFEQPRVYDSDTILGLERLPKTLGVVGAGAIGSEYACTFAALGAEVHLVDGRDGLLPFLDEELSHGLASAMERNGIVFHWNSRVEVCEPLDSGKTMLKCGSGASLTVDAVLVAAGRKSNTERLNLEAAGVTVGKRGLIPVDDRFRTSAPHVYAAGDVIGPPKLASTSIEQGRRAAGYALGARVRTTMSTFLPTGIYTIPEVSTVGETERSLVASGTDYVVGRARYDSDARGRIIGDRDGFLKLLFRRDDMLLVGVHVLGEQATELVHVGLMAMMTGSTADIFAEACFNFPTLAGLYKTATYDARRRALEAAAHVAASR